MAWRCNHALRIELDEGGSRVLREPLDVTANVEIDAEAFEVVVSYAGDDIHRLPLESYGVPAELLQRLEREGRGFPATVWPEKLTSRDYGEDCIFIECKGGTHLYLFPANDAARLGILRDLKAAGVGIAESE